MGSGLSLEPKHHLLPACIHLYHLSLYIPSLYSSVGLACMLVAISETFDIWETPLIEVALVI